MWKLLYLAPADIQVARVDRQAIVLLLLRSRSARVLGRARGTPDPPLAVRAPPSRRSLSAIRRRETFPVTLVPTGSTRRARLAGRDRTSRRVRPARVREDRASLAPNGRSSLHEEPHAGACVAGIRRSRALKVLFEAHVPPQNVHAAVRAAYGRRRRDELTCPRSRSRCRSSRRPAASPRRSISAIRRCQDDRRYGEASSTGRSAYRRLHRQALLPVRGGSAHRPGGGESRLCRNAFRSRRRPRRSRSALAQRRHPSRYRQRRLHRLHAPSEIHEYHFAADALLLYYPSDIELNAYRSPGKLFAYMAAGVPTVSVDLPVLREVLGDPPAARLVPPDSPDELACAVQEVLNKREGALELAGAARRRVAEFTWDERARRVSEFVDDICVRGYG